MKFDPVHDGQKAFRKLLAAAASPGLIVDLGEEARLLDLDLPLNGGMLLVALVLLDAETSFSLISMEETAQARTISQMTYARSEAADRADFLFVIGPDLVAGAIAAARAGSLVDPHLGATLVVQAGALRREGPLLLSGPGIETTVRLGVDLEGGWIAARAAKNVEYPLGVDLVLVDEGSRLAFLPRTTVIREEG
ncbi:MAG: phosphonate C-P lyase system protein PhnH [Rectinemataceae bacterium]